jgi:hypothetical protein
LGFRHAPFRRSISVCLMRRRYPIFKALAAHALALLLVGGAVLGLVHGLGLPSPFWIAVGLQAFLATVLGRWFGLARGWLLFQVGFLPVAIGLHALALPAWVYLVAFGLVLLLNWNSFRHGVPLYLTSAPANRRLEDLLRDQPPTFAFIDLGCGLAGTLCHLARVYPQARFTGVETAPLTFVLAWLRSLPRRNCRIRYRSLWQTPLGAYDVVYCFLSPLPMPALWEKAQAELKPGARLVSNTFGIPGVAPAQTIALNDWRGTRLLVWQKRG